MLFNQVFIRLILKSEIQFSHFTCYKNTIFKKQIYLRIKYENDHFMKFYLVVKIESKFKT